MISIQLNGETYSVSPATTLAQLVDQLALSQKRIAVELNGAIVPRSQHSHTVLTAADTVEIVTAIGGG